MADVHVDAGELDGPDDAPAVGGLGYGVEQAVTQARRLDHVGLILDQAVMAATLAASLHNRRGCDI